MVDKSVKHEVAGELSLILEHVEKIRVLVGIPKYRYAADPIHKKKER